MAASVINQWTAEGGALYGTLSTSVANTTGNWLVVVAAVRGSFNAVVQACDGARNYWVPVYVSTLNTGFPRVCVLAAPNARATDTVSISTTDYVDAIAVSVLEVSGLPLYVSVDATATGSNAGTPVTVSATTTTASDLAIVGAASDNSWTYVTPTGTGTWNGLATAFGTDGVKNLQLATAWQQTTTAGVWTCTHTVSATNSTAVEVTFKPTASAPTQPNPNWPATQYQVAFGYQPGDPTLFPTWTDITPRVEAFNGKRGRQYELDKLQAGTGSLTLRNNDGAFDPTNGSSIYAPNVVPYVPFRVLATWAGVTRPVFTGFVERWPQSWDDTRYGHSVAACVDTLAPLAATTLLSAVSNEILQDAPYAYWPCSEGQQSPVAGNLSGNTQNPLAIRASQVGTTGTTGQFGASLGLPGDTGTGWQMQGQPVAGPAYGYMLYTLDKTLPQPSNGFAIEFWANFAKPSSGTPQPIALTLVSQGSSTSFQPAFEFVGSGTNSDQPTLQVLSSTSNDSSTWTGFHMRDGLWHHYYMYVTSTHGELWIDNVNVIFHTWSITLPDGLYLLTVGGLATATQWFAGWDASYAHITIYTKQLAAIRLKAHYQAGATGFSGEDSGARTDRVLSYGNWTQPRLIDTGNTTMQPCADIASKSVPDALGDVNDTEVGLSLVDGAGTITFRSRSFTYNRTPVWVLGDGPGEIPYLGDVGFDYDPSFVNNQITVARNNGGQGYATDTTSQKKYFIRSLNRTTYADTDDDAVDQANWLIGRYKNPHLRVSEVTVDLAANPSLFPSGLAFEVGDVVTVTRRPTYAPTVTGTFIVQQVAPEIGPGINWKVKLTLSPADPFVLTCDDPVYGALGTYPLGW